MKSRNMMIYLLLMMAVLLSFVAITSANTPQAQLHVGRLWLNPEYDGAEGWNSGLQYPGGIARPNPVGTDIEIKRGWVNHGKKWGTYLWSKNWTSPEQEFFGDVGSYFYRSMNYDYPNFYEAQSSSGNMNYLYPVGIQEKLRWSRPTVTIDAPGGVRTVPFFPSGYDEETVRAALPDHIGEFPRPEPVIDPTLVTEEVVESVWRYIQGMELTRSIYAYPYGSPHQDYALQDIRLTNNGISGNVSDAPVLTGQSLSNAVWAQAFGYRNTASPNTNEPQDTDAMYIEPWGSANHTAVLMWDIDAPNDDAPGPDYGDPPESDEYLGHLVGNAQVLIGPVFVSSGPGAAYAVDDRDQPLVRMMYYERGVDYADKAYSPPYSDSDVSTSVKEQRELVTFGTYNLPLNTSYRDFIPTAGVAMEVQGNATAILAYGTRNGEFFNDNETHGWDLSFGESVRIVQVVAAGGIDQEEGRRIGTLWTQHMESGDDPATWMSAEDQALVVTGRDTALKAAALAYWNYHGSFAVNVTSSDLFRWRIPDMVQAKPAGHGSYDVPDAPRPPGHIRVRTAEGWGIEVAWGTQPEYSGNHDTGVNDFAGYRIWRQSGSRNAPWELLAEGVFAEQPSPAMKPSAGRGGIFTTRPTAPIVVNRHYYDWQVVPGRSYWYAVTAIDDGSQNWARPGRSLESARWWTWTGYDYGGVPAPTSVPTADPNEYPAPAALNPTIRLGTRAAVPGDSTAITITASLDTARSVHLVFTTTPGAISSAELIDHAFSGDPMSQTAFAVVGDTFSITLSSDTPVTLREGLLARIAVRLSPEVSEDVVLEWAAFPATNVDESSVDLMNGRLLFGGPGDVTGDGSITALDAAWVLQYCVRLREEINPVAADVSGNGWISPYDAALVIQKLLDPGFVVPARLRLASGDERVVRIQRDGVAWNVMADIPDGIVSGAMTLSIPAGSPVKVSSGLLSESRRDGEQVHVVFARSPSAERVLLSIEGHLTEPPRIVTAILNEGMIPVRIDVMPSAISLRANRPNPFNPSTTISFSIPRESVVSLAVYNLGGQVVRTLVNDIRATGNHTVTWDGRDSSGRDVSSGVYLYRLITEGKIVARRMTLVR
jgi:hypothetical protein